MTVSWHEAGQAWGAKACDWAYLTEPYGRPVHDQVFARTGVGQGTALLDIACGAGMALLTAAQRGATVSGLDAAESLVAIARARVPEADIRQGDMFALPFPDASFDVVTSFNGIWAGCDQALTEVRRVVKPGGCVGLSFWGAPRRMQLAGCFLALAATAPPSEEGELAALAAIGKPGVAEDMAERAGLTPVERGTVDSVSEWPDLEIAWRAIAALGPAWASLHHSGESAVKEAVTAALVPYYSPATGVRLVSELAYLICRA